MRNEKKETDGKKQRILGKRSESGKQRIKALKAKRQTGSDWVTVRERDFLKHLGPALCKEVLISVSGLLKLLIML